jgi:hypothetical protein
MNQSAYDDNTIGIVDETPACASLRGSKGRVEYTCPPELARLPALESRYRGWRGVSAVMRQCLKAFAVGPLYKYIRIYLYTLVSASV